MGLGPRVTRCPGLRGTVPEWKEMSRVAARSIPGQLNVPELVDCPIFFNKQRAINICILQYQQNMQRRAVSKIYTLRVVIFDCVVYFA